ncbi:unnamed protein product, partial [Closterium sp. Naga37s-1]
HISLSKSRQWTDGWMAHGGIPSSSVSSGGNGTPSRRGNGTPSRRGNGTPSRRGNGTPSTRVATAMACINILGPGQADASAFSNQFLLWTRCFPPSLPTPTNSSLSHDRQL